MSNVVMVKDMLIDSYYKVIGKNNMVIGKVKKLTSMDATHKTGGTGNENIGYALKFDSKPAIILADWDDKYMQVVAGGKRMSRRNRKSHKSRKGKSRKNRMKSIRRR